jgi:hypothetical protein
LAGLRRVGGFVDHRFQRVVVELARRRGADLVAEPDVDGKLLIELDEVDRDRRVGPARAGALAAGEVDLDGVGLGHIQDFVGKGFDLFARIHMAADYIRLFSAGLVRRLHALWIAWRDR